MKKYMLVIHYKFTDQIRNVYFETLKELRHAKAIYKGNKDVEILHSFRIDNVE